eukprot:6170664-Lingulodinium_polyedra.AAC.1
MPPPEAARAVRAFRARARTARSTSGGAERPPRGAWRRGRAGPQARAGRRPLTSIPKSLAP